MTKQEDSQIHVHTLLRRWALNPGDVCANILCTVLPLVANFYLKKTWDKVHKRMLNTISLWGNATQNHSVSSVNDDVGKLEPPTLLVGTVLVPQMLNTELPCTQQFHS
jgi:hypothetical protein